jgi:hypothetical protein
VGESSVTGVKIAAGPSIGGRRMNEIKVGDKVYTYYYGIRHIATVIAIRGQMARLRFTNESGWEVEHWRRISTLKKAGGKE